MSWSFFAYLSRLKLINRWSLMRNTQQENDAEHSLQVAMIAHALALIGRDRYGRETDPEHVLCLAVYHDATEVMTGDLPTPVKYYSDDLRGAYHHLEDLSARRLLNLLPEDLRASYAPCLIQEAGYDRDIVKAADKISAYIKCLEEMRAGNHEFDYAAENIRRTLEAVPYPEVSVFMRDFLPSFQQTLDELNHPQGGEKG